MTPSTTRRGWWRSGHAEPVPPDLRWLEQKDDGTFISAALDAGAEYLADSPDAFRLIAWLDEQTGRQLSINQAKWALRLCRALPMPDGSYHGVETSHESGAYKSLLRILDRATTEDDRVPESVCGHCGKHLDGASAEGGHRPEPGDLAVCIYCAGINTFVDAELRTAPMSEEAIDALPAEVAGKIREMQALLRAAIAKRLGGKRNEPLGEA